MNDRLCSLDLSATNPLTSLDSSRSNRINRRRKILSLFRCNDETLADLFKHLAIESDLVDLSAEICGSN